MSILATLKGRVGAGLAVLLVAAGMTWWHRHYGMIDFGGLDGGTLIQTGWSFYQGNIPYHDVPDPKPPLFYLGAGWSFRILGPSWSSLNWLACFYGVVTFLWSFALLTAITRRPWYALAVAIALQAVTMLPLSWFWYNEITSVAGALAFLSALALIGAPGNRWRIASFVAALALLLLVKLNTAVLLTGSILFLLVVRRETRWISLACLVAAALADWLLLALQHISVLEYLRLCSAFSDRLSLDWVRFCLIDSLPDEHLVGLRLFIAFAAACVILTRLDRDRGRRINLLAWTLMAAGVGLMQMATNNDYKIGDLVFLMVVMAVIAGAPGSRAARGLVLLALLVPTLLGLKTGITRERVVSIGVLLYAGSRPADLVVQEPAFFRGLRTESFFEKVLHELDGVLAQASNAHVPPEKIFFGPRIDFAYAAYGLPYSTGLPIWWEKVPSSHRGEEYPSGIDLPGFWTEPARWLPDGSPYDPRVQRFIDDRMQLCIFVRSYQGLADMSLFPPNLRGYIGDHYRRVDYPDIVVFEAK